MSERGSFVTEYINCEHCLKIAKQALLSEDKYHFGIQLPSWNKDESHLPIIAGKLGGTFSGSEFMIMEQDILPLLENKLCHPLRIAVLSDCAGEQFYTVAPAVKASIVEQQQALLK